jgi:hypothetical protein
MSDPVPPQQNKPPQSRVNVALLIIGVLVFVPGAYCTVGAVGSMFGSSDNRELELLLALVFGVPGVGLAAFGAWLIYAALPRRRS